MCEEFFCSYARRIWDIYDGWANLLSKATSEATQAWDIFKLVKILFWHAEKVQNRGLERGCHTNYYKLPYGYRWSWTTNWFNQI